MVTESHMPRVLVFSLRNIFSKALFRCAHFEFEDLISQIDSAKILAPQADPSNRRHRIASRIAFHAPIALNPGLPEIRLKGRYDLFLAICGAPRDLLMVNAVRNWRDVCKTSICLIDEFWAKEMDDHQHFLHILDKFDVVMLYYSQTVKPLSERIKSKCAFFPPGIDTTLFSPFPQPPKRVVDVYSIGRRSEVTHQKLLKMAAESGLFYLHDSIGGDQAINSKEHRALVANVAKRSRYFIVNPGLIDRPEKRGNQIEISNRYFEGAASGVIMVGERPDNGEFEKLFGWPDAVIHLPYNSSGIDTIINDLDRQPEKQDRIRRTNVAQALKRHDWAYRWETILNTVGLQPLPELLERKKRLESLAEVVLHGDAASGGATTQNVTR